MSKKQVSKPPKYIGSLNMNRLRGRMLRLPPVGRKKKEILIVYGHLTSLEQLLPLAEELNKYGGVTAPDLPGFGGMYSFYRIGEKATLDNLADYLAAFVKLFYKKRRVSIVGINFGFSVVTRMLQKYPDLAKKVEVLVSLDGYTHHEDLNVSPGHKTVHKINGAILSRGVTASLAKYTLYQPVFIKARYSLSPEFELSHKKLTPELIEQEIAQTVHNWQRADLRTHMATTKTKYRLNICQQTVNLPLTHLVYAGNKYHPDMVEQHLKVVFESVEVIPEEKPKARKTRKAEGLYSSVYPSLKRLFR